MRLRCVASLYDVYYKAKEVEVNMEEVTVKVVVEADVLV